MFCKEYSALPGPGGVLDQRKSHLNRMNGVSRAITDHSAQQQNIKQWRSGQAKSD